MGLLGPNGAGKTTTMRCIFGLVARTAARCAGTAPRSTAARLRFGYMPEERGLYPHMRVSAQLEYLARLSGLDRRSAAASVDRWLARLGLQERAESRLDALSHGNQQRVQLAAALVHDPVALVLDEPFAGLDPLGVEALSAMIADLARDGTAVLFSSHQLDLVEDVCQDIVVIDHGRVVMQGELERLRAASSRRYLAVGFRGSGRWTPTLEHAASSPPSPVARGSSSPTASTSRPWSSWRARRASSHDSASSRRRCPTCSTRRSHDDARSADRSSSSPGARSPSACKAARSRSRRSRSSRSSSAASSSPGSRTRRRACMPASPARRRPRSRLRCATPPGPATRGWMCGAIRASPPARRPSATGEADVLIVAGRRLVWKAEPDAELAAIVTGAVQRVRFSERAAALGLTATQAATLLAPAPLPASRLEPAAADQDARETIAFVSFIVLLMMVLGYGSAVAEGVAQEKGTRVMELLVCRVRPRDLLAGKVLGIGLVGFGQMLLALIAGAAAIVALDTVEVPDAVPATLASAVLWFALGYAFLSVAFAAVGALVSRVEDLSGAVLP